MRLNEITNSNRIWAKLIGTDIDRTTEYTYIIKLLKMLIKLNSHQRVVTFMHTIELFENDLQNLIDNDYGNYPNQNDIKKFKNKCKIMLKNIAYLKTKLP